MDIRKAKPGTMYRIASLIPHLVALAVRNERTVRWEYGLVLLSFVFLMNFTPVKLELPRPS